MPDAAFLPIRQIAYFVPDAQEAALAHHLAFGSGPYFFVRDIPLLWSRHRGVERLLDHSSAYGQWGDLMVEFVQQNNPGPSCFRDMYPEGSGLSGVHHVALFVDDVAAELARHRAAGREIALHAQTRTGTEFAMVDMVASLGHMLELYAPTEGLTGFYGFVAKAAQGYDGRDPVRPLTF